MSTNTDDLPGGWRPDSTLAALIPRSRDWRTFARVPSAQRYCACICGGGVYDLKRRAFLKPIIDRRNGRVRFRLATSDPAAGKLGAVKTPYYASVILTLTEGVRRGRNIQAHHTTHDPTLDHWAHLSWATAKENRKLAALHKSREGFANPNAKLTGDELAEFIADHDFEAAHFGRANLRPYAERFDASVDHLRRLATGKSRAKEVQAIRDRHRREALEHRREERRREEERRRNPGARPAETGNPFLDVYDWP